MLDEMFSIMQRINEIKSRFGLKRHNPVSETPDLAKRLNPSVAKSTYDEVQAAAIADVNSKKGERTKAVSVNDINKLAEQYADKNKIPSSLVKAVINAESGYNEKAVSPRGAMGLMQLMPATVKEMGVGDPFDPEQNIGAGVDVLSRLLKEYQWDYKKALSAYNSGKKTVDRHNGVPDYPETKNFVNKVIDNYLKNRD